MTNRRAFLKQMMAGSTLAAANYGFRPSPPNNRSSRNRTIPGEIITPYPTIHNLAMEWLIEGDE